MTEQEELARAKEVLNIEIEGLQSVRDALDNRFIEAIKLIREALGRGGKIVITGLGKNLHIGMKMAATFTSTGSPAVVLHPGEAMHGDLGILADIDIIIALSYSGASDELLTLLPALRRSPAAIIALTGEEDSELACQSDLVLPVRVPREACPFNMAPTTSTTATLAMGDALAMVLLQAKGFAREDYAKLHPGGAIGRTLLLRVEDVMRTGNRVARARPTDSVREALLAMTSSRSGCLVIVNDEQRVEGIFTDGDLRRHVMDGQDLAAMTLESVMTRNPVSLKADALAVDLLALFEEHAIDDVVVTDPEGKLLGLVDIQDLPKLKIL